MFKIDSVRPGEEVRTLKLSAGLFHDALKDVPESMARYHVENDKGEDFDIVYWDNDEDIEPKDAYPAYVKRPYMVKYLQYDENDRDTLYLDFFKGLKKMYFEELNEYTIAISKVVLNFTDMEIWCNDSRILWFIDETPRLHIVEDTPKWEYDDDCFYIQEQIRSGLEDNNFNRLGNTYAFHNIFLFQWILNGESISKYKYVTLPINDTGGIGAVLSGYKKYQAIFNKLGLKFVAPDEEHLGKFPREMVEHYFSVDIWNPEANEDNTLQIPNLVIFVKTKLYTLQPGLVDKSLISQSFRGEMDEYYDALFDGKKTLGVLIRGSDYIATGLSGPRKMASVEQMAPGIRKWMSEYGYEKIFLATEDSDILSQMKKEFGKSMVALSQRRITNKDLRVGQIISDYEKENGGDEYFEKLEDTTINYFYALYILSRCDAFMCSGQCNGWDTVISLNENRFERTYKYSVGINGDPRTEGWKEVGPVKVGMFARGVYPTDKAFFMTYRFDLEDNVNVAALKEAWENTIKIYPYVTYATVVRMSNLVYVENNLPFVFEETGEVIEPSTPAANFHFVTMCYLGKTLWLYVDHVPFDGTGFKYVLETFFYNYYCILDKCQYEKPEGVYSIEDGVVPGQDVDAIFMVEPMDPKALMGPSGQQKTFEVLESPKDHIFLTRSECRGFCISVPSEEFMRYAKSINGSPMSVLAVCIAKAVQRVHPENELPIQLSSPVSIRKVMGSTNSLLPQVVHYNHCFDPNKLINDSDKELNQDYRTALKGFSSEEIIKKAAGAYRSISEGFAKAFAYGMLDKLIVDQRKSVGASIGISYLGKMRTGDYGNRIRMTAFHAMQERGIMVQTAEMGNRFYIDWYQGLLGEEYVKALRDIMAEKGITGILIERVE